VDSLDEDTTDSMLPVIELIYNVKDTVLVEAHGFLLDNFFRKLINSGLSEKV